MRKLKIIFIIVFALIGLVELAAGIIFYRINPPRDDLKNKNYPSEFFCDKSAGGIDYQTKGNCSAYAAAYVLRYLGEEIKGEDLAEDMKRIFGFVPATSIVSVFKKHGFSAKAYHGDISCLKYRLSLGVPVIAFVSVPGDTHYLVVVGYDSQYFYLVDSLYKNKNTDHACYNRKITVDEFERIRKTNTLLSDNIYIAVV